MSGYLGSFGTPVVFTAGDLVEGLGFLEPVERRATLFGLEQRLDPDVVIDMTHTAALQLQLTELAREVVRQQPRHIRLNYLFWQELPGGVIAPLIALPRLVQGAFGGMTWADLRRAYERMVWIDPEFEAEHFLMIARREGLL